MTGILVLLLGIAAIAASMGFMVGGSASPVVGVALPAIFGLVVTAIGVFRPRQVTNEELKLYVHSDNHAQLKEYMQRLQLDHARLPIVIGLSLLVFGSVYLAGTIVGAYYRIQGMFSTPTVTAFPWESKTKPKSLQAALYWMDLQDSLRARGYSPEQVKQLYDIQIEEWETEKSIRNYCNSLSLSKCELPKGEPPKAVAPPNTTLEGTHHLGSGIKSDTPFLEGRMPLSEAQKEKLKGVPNSR